jgi:hypothetical protein
MDCWKCGKQISDGLVKIGFRAACIHCGIDLHVCKNCRYYAPGKPNDCAVPGTEFIKDRDAFNFCEEYRPKLPPSGSGSILGVVEKKDFGSLFKDEDK